MGLEPEDAREQLELRAERLAAELANTERELAGAPPGLPRLFLLEEEYRTTMLQAELAWLRGVIDDLRERRLDWNEQWLHELARTFLPPNTENKEKATPPACSDRTAERRSAAPRRCWNSPDCSIPPTGWHGRTHAACAGRLDLGARWST
jgi:hypothetical protein